ncbi:MAG: hypothetical protein H6704_26635 [Myxococcales bacterium]|nr:hypothetical protein [Myxococcales bacterium]
MPACTARRSALSLALTLALVGPSAAAAPSPEAAREAQALSDQARAHYQAGRFEEAVAAYLAAFDRIEEPLLLKNAIKVLAVHIGDCDQTVRLGDDYLATGPERGRAEEVAGYMGDCLARDAEGLQAEGKLADAEARLRRAASLPLPAPQRARIEALQAALDAARPVPVGVRVIDVGGRPVASPTITVDGAPATRDAEGRVALVPGRHTVRAAAPGFLDATASVEAAKGAQVTLRLAPRAVVAPAPPRQGPRAMRVAGWSAVGVALAAAVAAVAVDLEGQAAVDDLEAVADAGTDRARYDDLKDDAEVAQLWSTVLYGTAAVAGAAGVTLLVLDAEVAPSVAPEASGAGLSIGGRF